MTILNWLFENRIPTNFELLILFISSINASTAVVNSTKCINKINELQREILKLKGISETKEENKSSSKIVLLFTVVSVIIITIVPFLVIYFMY